MKALLLHTLLLLLLQTSTAASSYQNVYENDLEPCSSDGMALTGYTRNSYCIDQNDDTGSHHVCIDLSSTSGGNFCSVTGQSDWCSESMPCVQDTSQYCKVQNWCVCQWAFASYVETAGGCDQIQDIVCESINEQAILAYQKQLSSSTKYRNALECLFTRCGLDSSVLVSASSVGSSSGSIVATWLLVGAVVAGMAYWVHRHRRQGKKYYWSGDDGVTAKKTQLVDTEQCADRAGRRMS